MKVSNRINHWVHPMFRRYVYHAYRRKIKIFERERPELFNPVSPELVKAHKSLWERLGVPCSDRWLRLFVNLTGTEDYTFCPEDVYFARIERIMNPTEMASRGIEDKNGLDVFLDKDTSPETIVRFMRNSFYDKDYNWMDDARVNRILKEDMGDLVVKPGMSCGGSGVERAVFRGGCYQIESGVLDASHIRRIGGESYVVQKKIIQDAFSSSFNASSANTCRVMTMRCPWNGEVVVLKTVIRLGTSDALVNNFAQGGVLVCINAQGQFGHWGYDHYGRRFEVHPTSGIRFAGVEHPAYANMVHITKEIARRVPYYNLLGFDLLPDHTGKVKVVEINATSIGIDGIQFDFGGLFGEHTEQVVDWCAANKELDTFNHFRTWF